MNPTLSQQASRSAQQGQQAQQGYQTQAGNYRSQYGDYSGQAQQANQQLQDYTKYMQGAGSATNLYNTALGQAQASQGFNPETLAIATKNLTQSQNALAGLGQAAQEGVNSYGLTGAQLASRYASQVQPLQGVVTAQGNAVNNLQQLYQNALTQANQFAGLGVQGEQATLSGLNSTYQNAANVRDSALNQMQFYEDLAQKQGGLNAQNAAQYAQAQQAYASAQQAISQSQLLIAQAAQQRLQTTSTQDAIRTLGLARALGLPEAARNPNEIPLQVTQSQGSTIPLGVTTPGPTVRIR